MGEAKRKKDARHPMLADLKLPLVKFREVLITFPESTWDRIEAEAWKIETETSAATGRRNAVYGRDVVAPLVLWALELQEEIRKQQAAETERKAQASNLVQAATYVPPGMAAAAEKLRALKEGR